AAPAQAPAPSQTSTGVHASPSSQLAPALSNAHVASQQSPVTRFPSSQASPAVTMPLPQRVIVQLESQPSPSIALPSSHSSPGFGTPLPQVTSSAPASMRGPETRGAPSRSASPGGAT